MKHKWYNEIVAWAGGAEIERNYLYREVAKWEAVPVSQPIDWGSSSYEYRIKPQPKEPKYLYVTRQRGLILISEYPTAPSGSHFIGKIEVQDD